MAPSKELIRELGLVLARLELEELILELGLVLPYRVLKLHRWRVLKVDFERF